MRHVIFTDGFKKQANKLCRKNPSLRKQLAKQFQIFSLGEYSPPIRLHKLRGRRSTQYAIWIESDLRAIAVKDGDAYIFFELAAHDKY
ncbi:hypothetical protein A3B02_02275 [Candidatus Roizmanbacteria bacterium RIFCSPLOWO2_01_FULL_42_14]|uniref:Plasmid stabilization protein n=3 Tax=Candidatus Roizmaniibacteriota TaxID=1752723 RepID=A0A1F7JXH1_9BACT|nr:MAG: hypothetical protein A3D08_01190 [Candidatus Roizmanbacteria bacterium RIFCSPHIGHO2_02_FULL_43_11]OGK51949.1 MAG: hypothetical protein A3B02_02275 [Candidatus Roizmanbacteria bacterium RIFCSPLOWO2_01_FULL_42_14]OGK60298.1 MAG: hypothetical protein A3I56_04370 [Candidatus Roizmanbacteria bacterium RIFCSPLOWO2_02_FULL_43_10]